MDNLVNNIHIKIYSQPNQTGEYSVIKYNNGNIINQYKLSEQHVKELLESCNQKQVTYQIIDSTIVETETETETEKKNQKNQKNVDAYLIPAQSPFASVHALPDQPPTQPSNFNC